MKIQRGIFEEGCYAQYLQVMINFQRGDNQFNFRSIALIIEDNHVLIQKDLKDDFWTLPGGRVEFFENSNDTVVREINEELGWKAKVIRPIWYLENFFRIGSTNIHEIATIYLLELLDSNGFESNLDFTGIEDHLIFRWIDISNLNEINLKPKELKSKLNRLPSIVEFITIRQESK